MIMTESIHATNQPAYYKIWFEVFLKRKVLRLTVGSYIKVNRFVTRSRTTVGVARQRSNSAPISPSKMKG